MKKKLVAFDMDGTVYLGDQLIDGAKDCFNYLIKNNIEYVFVTNNSSHDLDSYLKKMARLGIPCDMHNFYSSVEVTMAYLKKNNIKDVYVVGNKCFRDKISSIVNIITDYNPNQKIDAVLCAFSTELVYKELKEASLYLQTTDAEFIATNGDWRCPIEGGLYIPDNGGMCEWLRLTTGKTAKVLGKPSPEMLNFLAEEFNLNKSELLVVGDRLYTDIQVGINAGVDSVLVLSGESTLQTLEEYPNKPTYVLNSIAELPDLLNK